MGLAERRLQNSNFDLGKRVLFSLTYSLVNFVYGALSHARNAANLGKSEANRVGPFFSDSETIRMVNKATSSIGPGLVSLSTAARPLSIVNVFRFARS